MVDIVSCCTEPFKEAGKWIGQQIFQQLTFLWFFTKNIKSLRDEAQVLDSATKGLQLQVDKATDNVEVTDPEVVNWIKMSEDIQGETSKILDEASMVESHHLKVVDRSSLSKRAKEMTDRLKNLRDEKKFGLISHSPSPAKRIVLGGKTFECESRNKIEEEIMATLRGGDENMIGICGMGGLGKTTMAEKIMNRALKENVFEEVVMAVVSQNVDISKIQDGISLSLRLKLSEETTESARVQKLHARLSDTKRTLLVLDDIWEKPPLKSIGIPRDSKWCTILFTSRNHDALQLTDVGKIFGMEVLSEEEAWSFFRVKAGTCVDDRELNPIAKQVAKECGGLPINLAAVGAMLKDKLKAGIWKDTLRKLKKSVPDTLQYDKESYNPLKLSYENLNSKEAQSIFLLCCLFPEDADITWEYLTIFSMGLRLFEEDITNREQATDKMCALTEFLKDRSLLLESDKKDCVRMHDVVRDVCRAIAKEEGYIGKDGCTWISSSHLVGEGNVLLSGSSCPNLRLLFLDSTYDDSSRFKLDDAFLQGMRELYVLCIGNYLSLTTLSHPTQSLGKLNTLILDSCPGLETISVVGELVNLEILICRDCYGIQELPSEMKELKSLKVLELTRCRNLYSIGRGIISCLVGLEELKLFDSFDGWEANDEEERENAALRELEALSNLACLEIDIHDPSLLTENMPRFSKNIVRFRIRTLKYFDIPSEFSKTMSLCLERETRLGDWIEMQLLRDIECLYLKGDGANNVELAKIQNIRWLELSKCGSIKNVVRTSGGSDDATVFPSIEHLKLYSLLQLQEICDGPVSSTSFQNLKELELIRLWELTQFWKSSSVCHSNYVPHFSNLSSIVIEKCDSLRNLGQLSMAGKDCLSQLQQLHIERCETMEQVFLWNDDAEAAGKNRTSIESQRKLDVITKVFPKLKEVKLVSLPNLTTFYQGIQRIEFPLLTQLQIDGCPKMKSIIIGSSGADIDDDDSLLVLNEKVSFGSLEVLEIDSYAGSMSFFTLSVAANLRELSISNSKEMINVIEDEQQQQRILVFPQLEFLLLSGLPKLVTFCECDIELPSLRIVRIRFCRNMESFSMGFVAAPNLKIVEIDYHEEIGTIKDLNGALHQHYLAQQKENEEEEEEEEEEDQV